MNKVLLLNPPGKQLYIRDYFCSKVSQADYLPPPIDLVFVSGRLSTHYDISLIDAIAGKLTPEKTLEMIKQINPDAIISLVGSVSIKEDAKFIKELRMGHPSAKIICAGDAFLERDTAFISTLECDAFFWDFTSEDILHYLNGDYGKLQNFIFKREGNICVRSSSEKKMVYSMPSPRHELFLKYGYRHPFIKRRKFIMTLVDYGCPYACKFCVMSTLDWKLRDVNSIIDELRYAQSLSVSEILFGTQTFGVNKKHTIELCERMVSENFNFGWVCFSRADVLDDETLKIMKKAGCHTIILGIESGAQEILDAYRKGYKISQITNFIDQCRAMGIETVGTFILGLPDETKKTMRDTLRLLKKIPLDYASFNVAVPRAGTELRKDAVELGLAAKSNYVMDQSGTEVAMKTKTLSKKDILSYRRKAVFTFYGRPSYMLRRAAKMQSFFDLYSNFKNAVALLRQTYLK